jgi:hypothetical protein
MSANGTKRTYSIARCEVASGTQSGHEGNSRQTMSPGVFAEHALDELEGWSDRGVENSREE